jgi:hypothetical protein
MVCASLSGKKKVRDDTKKKKAKNSAQRTTPLGAAYEQ